MAAARRATVQRATAVRLDQSMMEIVADRVSWVLSVRYDCRSTQRRIRNGSEPANSLSTKVAEFLSPMDESVRGVEQDYLLEITRLGWNTPAV